MNYRTEKQIKKEFSYCSDYDLKKFKKGKENGRRMPTLFKTGCI